MFTSHIGVVAILSMACLIQPAFAGDQVAIEVDASRTVRPFSPIWRYFGYDEPNYTYMPHGRKLLGELGRLGSMPAYIRTHNLLTTGDGKPALKWGSTNAYSEDASGHPVYDWTIVDRIFDTYLAAGTKPFVELGFMPEPLSTHSRPYRHHWPKGGIDTGWAYPPTSYEKWGELVYRLAKHCAERYGEAEATSWYWEVWNEPDILYWHGTPEEYNKLYDYAAKAVKRALSRARVGGPATTGPGGGGKAAAFLRQFLEHCRQTHAPLDFVSYHAKGKPKVVEGHVQMGLSNQLRDIQTGFKILEEFQQFRNLPVILTESDPEGCAACSVSLGYAQNTYRNGALFPAYTAAAMDAVTKLAAREKITLEGFLTWSFEFEDQPYFDGFRSLATNGIDKPILNFFRMVGMINGDVVESRSSGAVDLDTLINQGVKSSSDVDALAVRSDRKLAVMVWNYHDDDLPAPQTPVAVHIRSLPADVSRVLLRQYRVDREHSNAFTAWKAMGSPQNPSAGQYARLERAGQLQEIDSPQWVMLKKDGRSTRTTSTAELKLDLPRQAVALFEISW